MKTRIQQRRAHMFAVVFVLICVAFFVTFSKRSSNDTQEEPSSFKPSVVTNLATVNGYSYFIACLHIDCALDIMKIKQGESMDKATHVAETFYDNGYAVSPDKKKIAFIHVINNTNSLYVYSFDTETGVDIRSDAKLKSDETLVCEVESYGLDIQSCGHWIDDRHYRYGIYKKSDAIDQKLKLLREETYTVK